MRGRVFRRGKTWTYVVDVGADTHANRRQEMKGGFATKKDAERALRQLLHRLDHDQYVERSALTFSTYIRGEWLPAMKPNLREATWAGYRRTLEDYALPHVGHVPLQQLNAVHLNRLYTRLLTSGRADGRGGLSPRTVRYVHTLIRKSLADGARWGRVERNVADLADPPRAEVDTSGIRTWTAQQLGRFLAHVRDERLYPAWVVFATTGMRRGEVLGLRWIDVDLDGARISVRQTLVMVDTEARYSQPKTKRSRRTVDLDEQTVAVLRAWQTRQRAEREQWREAWQDTGLVFTREDGSPIYPDGWTGTFERHVREAGLPKVRLHDLRHTHASLLLASGVNPKVVSERLGHHSTAFTLDTYAHVIPGMQRRAAQDLTDLVLGHAGDATTDTVEAEDDDVLRPPDDES